MSYTKRSVRRRAERQKQRKLQVSSEVRAQERLLPTWQRAFALFFAFTMIFFQIPVTAFANTDSGDGQAEQAQVIAEDGQVQADETPIVDEAVADEAAEPVQEPAVEPEPAAEPAAEPAMATLSEDDPVVAKIGETEYTSLADAISAVPNNGTITMVADVEGAQGLTVDTQKTFTIDFDSHSYSMCKPGTSPDGIGTGSQGLYLKSGQTITMKNGSIVCDESNKSETQETEHPIRMLINSYANLTLDNMGLDGSNLSYLDDNGDYLMIVNDGTVSIENGTTVTANEGDVAFCISAAQHQPSVTLTGSTINGDIVLDGGELIVPQNDTATVCGSLLASTVTKASAANIAGGTFTKPITLPMCADGYYPVLNSDGNWGVKLGTPIAFVDHGEYVTYHESAKDALSAAASGDYVMMEDEIDETEQLVVGEGVTFDITECESMPENGICLSRYAQLLCAEELSEADFALLSCSSGLLIVKAEEADESYSYTAQPTSIDDFYVTAFDFNCVYAGEYTEEPIFVVVDGKKGLEKDVDFKVTYYDADDTDLQTPVAL